MKPKLLILIVLCCLGGLVIGTIRECRLKQELAEQKKYIPSPTELQQLLKNAGHPRYNCGPVDGAIGPMTLQAWDNYICDRYASKTDWYYEN